MSSLLTQCFLYILCVSVFSLDNCCDSRVQALGAGDGQRSLASCSPWGGKELDTTERLNCVPVSQAKCNIVLSNNNINVWKSCIESTLMCSHSGNKSSLNHLPLRSWTATVFWFVFLSPMSRAQSSQVALVVKEPICQCRRCKRRWFDPWTGTILWRRAW